ncbi:MAG: hypothetical protein L0226_00360, partial [Acidobacteria bacterium]|nr:hypothetical protein [Acidobacteriota bacterium]
MNSETEKWRRVEELFHDALEIAPGHRAQFLDRACAGDETIRREVESLLAAHPRPENLLIDPALGTASKITRIFSNPDDTTAHESSTDTTVIPPPAQLIGHYKLIRELGRGGMGAVYLAERADDQYHKQVAIKLIRRALCDETIIRRFRTERQIL